MRFTAIDFETANSARASACSVGLIVVNDGKIEKKHYHLRVSFNHHDALEDARACAMIAVKACELHAVTSLHDLKETCGLKIGSLYSGGYRACGAARKR